MINVSLKLSLEELKPLMNTTRLKPFVLFINAGILILGVFLLSLTKMGGFGLRVESMESTT